ncbi:MAG: response regulator, partial [Sphingomonadales bacterium]|nr:response regulator [Sphingomonadales bacterium]
FNNILQVIIGNLQILNRQSIVENNDKSKEKIGRVIKAADKARDLTKRLLAFSRRQVLETIQCNVNVQLLEFQAFLTRSLREDINIKLHLAEVLWASEIDISQFENAILNLCVNSAGAMPSGGSIIIETKNEILENKVPQLRDEAISGEYISVSITDNGTGIAEDILPRILEPFFTTKDQDKGTGLGLSMVYGFVEQTGGFMEFQSELHVGTTMTLYFPRSTNDKPTAIKSSEPSNNQITNGSNKTILLVEDNPDVQEVIVSILEDRDYTVLPYDEPIKAKTAVEKGLDFDLLLTDVIMPGDYRGPDLADAIRKLKPDLKVLFLSGYADNAFLGHQSLGENEKFLSKPIDDNELLNEVQSLLNK